MVCRLFQLDIRHDWYADRRLPKLRLEPDGPTRDLFRRYGLRLHADHGRFTLLGPDGAKPDTFLTGLTAALDDRPLRFFMQCDQALLASITELPEGWIGLPGFSNAEPGLAADPQGEILLAPASAQESLHPGEVRLHPSRLKAAGGDAVWVIAFAARQVPWLYYIINRSQTRLQNPQVRGSDDSRLIAAPAPVTLPDGNQALVFHSDAVGLSTGAGSKPRYSLYDRIASPLSQEETEVCLLGDLPTPSPDSLQWNEQTTPRRICAAAYVYL